MDLLWFCTLFIFQFVFHRVGDFLLQSDRQAKNKANDIVQRFEHCITYSLTIALPLLFIIPARFALLIFILTFIEHMIIDSRTPITEFKRFFEVNIMRNKDYREENLPFFLLIEIDQTFHMVRIFLISIVFSYFL